MSEVRRKAFLGIDTSNYRTSSALYYTDGTYVSSRKLLPVPSGEKGLRQSEAVFSHIKQFSEVFEALDFGDTDILGVGVSETPRNIAGSYMPCFSFGKTVAESLAHALNVECFRFSHQQGHIAAGLLSCGRTYFFDRTFFALHASGGTTEIVRVSGTDRIDIVSKTLDINIGQLIDRTGVSLGLNFPCGQAFETLAEKCDETINVKVKLKDGNCCLSGYENKVNNMIREGKSGDFICAYITEVCGKVLAEMLVTALSEERLPVLCAGGVLANKKIRKIIAESFNLLGFDSPEFASEELSGDNAVGVAYLACRNYNFGEK